MSSSEKWCSSFQFWTHNCTASECQDGNIDASPRLVLWLGDDPMSECDGCPFLLSFVFPLSPFEGTWRMSWAKASNNSEPVHLEKCQLQGQWLLRDATLGLTGHFSDWLQQEMPLHLECFLHIFLHEVFWIWYTEYVSFLIFMNFLECDIHNNITGCVILEDWDSTWWYISMNNDDR